MSRRGGAVPATRWWARLTRAGFGGRALSALTASGLSSVGNLLLSVAVARRESVSGLGHFAIAFSCYILGTGLARAAVTDGVLATAPRAGSVRAAAGRAGFVALLVALPVTVLATTTGSRYLLVIGLALPGLAQYDFNKAISLGLGRPRLALLQEVLWTGSTLVAALLGITKAIEPVTVFAVWAGSAAAVGYGVGYTRHYHLRPAWRLGREQTRLAVSFAGQYLVTSGSAQLVTTALAALAGTAVVGALSAGRTALGPMTLVVASAATLTLPYLARTARAPLPVRRRAAARLALLLTVGTLPLAAALIVLPGRIGGELLGASWPAARPLLPALAAESLFALTASVGFAGHRVARAGTRALVLGGVLSLLRVGLVLAAGALFAARGAAGAMAVMAVLSALVWWRSYLSVLRRTAGRPLALPGPVPAVTATHGRAAVPVPLSRAAVPARTGRRRQRVPGQ